MPKNFKLSLLDNKPDGLISLSSANSVNIIYKIPRSRLRADLQEHEHLFLSGVYILIGSLNTNGLIPAYVGKVNAVENNSRLLGRLRAHSQGDWWHEVYFLTRSNSTINHTESAYLEFLFYEELSNNENFDLKNKRRPNSSLIDEKGDIDDLNDSKDRFIELLSILENKFIRKTSEIVPISTEKQKKPKSAKQLRSIFNKKASLKKNKMHIQEVLDFEPKEKNSKLILYSKSYNYDASCILIDGKYKLLKYSKISPEIKTYAKNSVRKNRVKFKDFINSEFLLTHDIWFDTPSAAAEFVSGASENGWLKWKDASGVSLSSCIRR